MNDLVAVMKAEALRLRRWPTFWILLGTWLALNLTFTYVFNYITYKTGNNPRMSNGLPKSVLLQQMLPNAVPEVFTQGMAMFGGALMLVLGALAVGSGYGWGTWKSVFTQGPSRTTVITGTVLSLVTVVVTLVLVAFAVDTAVATGIASTESQSLVFPALSHMLAGIATGIAILVMWTLAGGLIGALAKGPALAVGLGLVWVLVVENLLRGVASILGPMKVITNYLPGTAAGSLAGAMQSVKTDTTPGVLDVLTRNQSAVALAIYIALFSAVTLVLIRRRDLV